MNTDNPNNRFSISQNVLQSISRIRDRMEQRHSLPATSPPTKPLVVDLTALEYVGPFDHNLMCAICHSPFVHPVKVDCGHVFCEDCIGQALDHQNLGHQTCPTCRGKANEISIVPVPKILDQILDELLVKCPLSSQGCTAEIPRGSVQDHINQYCEYLEIECPFNSDCSEPVQRKYLWQDKWQNRCLHNFVQCSVCGDMVIELEHASHFAKHDSLREVSCPGCKTRLRNYDLEKHSLSCPEFVVACTAAPYGCDFTSRRVFIFKHTQTCPLAKLTPFLELQNDRLSAHEAALKHLRHKNSLLETSLHSIQECLKAPTGLFESSAENNAQENDLDNPPFDSTAHHLLCLHESLREEVARVAAAVSELDARASMTVMNESLRVKEEMAHTNAAIGAMRMQLHWLLSARLQTNQQNQQQQQQQRVAVIRDQGQEGGASDGVGGTSGLGGGASELGPLTRQSSDTMRQDTKL